MWSELKFLKHWLNVKKLESLSEWLLGIIRTQHMPLPNNAVSSILMTKMYWSLKGLDSLN
jgi:hypothetical protein